MILICLYNHMLILVQGEFSGIIYSMKLDLTELEKVADFFRAFSEPTRLALLQELKEGPMSVGDLVAALHTTQPNISKQLKILKDAHLVERKKDGKNVLYSICEPAVMDLCQIACNKLNSVSKPRELSF